MAKRKNTDTGVDEPSDVELADGQGEDELATMAATNNESAGEPQNPAAKPARKLVGLAFDVSIPHCLLGTRRVVVDSKFMDDAVGAKDEAIRLYKGNAIRSHEHQADVRLIGPVYEEASAAE